MLTYLKILPLMETFPVKGHLWSTKSPSIASLGVLKPKIWLMACASLTKSDLLVESNTAACLFGNEFFGVKEDADLFLIGFFVLFDKNSRLNWITNSPKHLSSLVVKYTKDFSANK
jgi:hypothetical protein